MEVPSPGRLVRFTFVSNQRCCSTGEWGVDVACFSFKVELLGICQAAATTGCPHCTVQPRYRPYRQDRLKGSVQFASSDVQTCSAGCCLFIHLTKCWEHKKFDYQVTFDTSVSSHSTLQHPILLRLLNKHRGIFHARQ